MHCMGMIFVVSENPWINKQRHVRDRGRDEVGKPFLGVVADLQKSGGRNFRLKLCIKMYSIELVG